MDRVYLVFPFPESEQGVINNDMFIVDDGIDVVLPELLSIFIES